MQKPKHNFGYSKPLAKIAENRKKIEIMKEQTIKRKKNWKLELIAFIALMLILMIDDAINHPKDFIKGYSVTSPK